MIEALMQQMEHCLVCLLASTKDGVNEISITRFLYARFHTAKVNTFLTETKHFLSLPLQIVNHHITFYENSETDRTYQTLF